MGLFRRLYSFDDRVHSSPHRYDEVNGLARNPRPGSQENNAAPMESMAGPSAGETATADLGSTSRDAGWRAPESTRVYMYQTPRPLPGGGFSALPGCPLLATFPPGYGTNNPTLNPVGQWPGGSPFPSVICPCVQAAIMRRLSLGKTLPQVVICFSAYSTTATDISNLMTDRCILSGINAPPPAATTSAM